jgi:hypothetical protein
MNFGTSSSILIDCTGSLIKGPSGTKGFGLCLPILSLSDDMSMDYYTTFSEFDDFGFPQTAAANDQASARWIEGMPPSHTPSWVIRLYCDLPSPFSSFLNL